jgi:hypothetical protein
MKSIACVSMIVAAIVVGWAATATIPAAAVSVDDVSLKFLPPDTQGIACIDVAALRNAPLVQTAMQNKVGPAIPPPLADFVSATGFDPQQDVDKITVAKVGTQNALMIVQGRIDKFKVEQYLKDKGKEPQAYLGQTLYIDGNGAFLLSDNLVVMGQPDAVKKAVDQMQVPGSLPLRSDLMAAIQTIDAGNQIWAVGDFSVNDLGTAGVPAVTPVLAILKSLQGGTYQMRIDTDIHAVATGNFADSPSAQNLGDMVRGLLAVAKLQVAQKQPDMLRVLDGIQVSNSGPKLTVRVDESGDILKRLQKLKPAGGLGQ